MKYCHRHQLQTETDLNRASTMSNFENSTLQPTNELLKSTVSFGEMFDKIVDDDNRTENLRGNWERFSLNPYDNDEIDYKNSAVKRTDNPITKMSLNTDMFDTRVNADVKQNDCHLISDYDQNQIIPSNNNCDRSLSAQDSLCTECRFGNKQMSFFSSFDNTQLTQTNCFSSMMDPIIDHGDKDVQYSEDRLLQNRFISDSTGKKDSDINTKQFDTHEVGRTFSQISDHVGGPLDIPTPDRITSEKLQTFENVGNSPLTHTVHKIEKTSIVDNIPNDDEAHHSLPNDVITLQSQNFNGTASNCRYSSSSQNTIKQFYCVGVIDEIGELMSNIQETDSLKGSSSAISGSTIEEVYLIDAADVDSCSTSIKAINIMPESETAKNNPVQSTIETEIIKNREVTDQTVTRFDHEMLIDSRPSEINVKETNAVQKTCLNNRKAEEDLESQHLAETHLNEMEREDKITAKNVVPAHRNNDPVTDINSAKDSKFMNGEVPKVADESVLKISIESESEHFVKQPRIARKEKTSSAHVVDNLKTDFSYLQNASRERPKTVPINLSIVNTNGIYDRNIINSKVVGTKNLNTIIWPDDSDTELLSASQLNNIERQDEIAMNEITPANCAADLAANTTFIEDQNTSNRDVQEFQDDLSLEFLSDSELQRIEEEAYMKTKKPSAANLRSVNPRTVINERDVFYRPEQLNMTTDKSDNDLVLPNWVKNPAPEPNYDKMKQAVQMQRSYIKRMLQEILRLSTIVSKVGSIVYTDPEHSHTGVSQKSNSQIEEHCPIPLMKNKPNNQSSELGTSGDTEKNTYRCGNAVTKHLEDSDTFHIPKSNRLNYSAPSSTKVAAHTARINANGLSGNTKGSGKFYDPQVNRSKYDLPFIFNRQSNAEFKRDNIGSSYMQTSASNIFGSLKRDFNGNRCCERDLWSVPYNGRERETGVQIRECNSSELSNKYKKSKSIVKAKYKLPKISPCATITSKDKKVEAVCQNDSIFYLPDECLPTSSNRTVFPSTKNSQKTVSSVNYKERLPASNIVRDSTSHTTRNNDGIFYEGNCEMGTHRS